MKHSNLQTDICFKVVGLLDQRNIKLSSVEPTHFCWEGQDTDVGNEIVTTPITVGEQGQVGLTQNYHQVLAAGSLGLLPTGPPA